MKISSSGPHKVEHNRHINHIVTKGKQAVYFFDETTLNGAEFQGKNLLMKGTGVLALSLMGVNNGF